MNLDRAHLEALGEAFELEVLNLLRMKYPNGRFFHNVELYSAYLGKDTQIDLMMLTDNGVYVIEAKNWVGFIRGTYNDKYWQGRSRSQNTMQVFSPINQNDIHIRALRNALRCNGVNPPIFSSIVVVPDGTAIQSNCAEVINKSKLLVKINSMERDSKIKIDKVALYNAINNVVK